MKSASFDSTERDCFVGKRGDIISDWRADIEDVAFQAIVVSGALPGYEVLPYLLLPDKSKRTDIDNLTSLFSVKRLPLGNTEICQVTFHGDRDALIASNFLTRVSVAEPVGFVLPLVREQSQRFAATLDPLVRESTPIGRQCKECPFNIGKSNDGYHECWKALADVSPNLFDLYYGTALKEKDGRYLIDRLLSESKAALLDVPQSALKGKRGERQNIQVEMTAANKEWLSGNFGRVVEEIKYPLHFIDFETSTSAVPYHKGMRPYEQIAFQWSCHTIDSPSAAPRHSEWINLEDAFPSFKFAETLRSAVGESGTIFMWANHENLVLKDIRRQSVEYGYSNDPELRRWIDTVVVDKDNGSAGCLSIQQNLLSELFPSEHEREDIN